MATIASELVIERATAMRWRFIVTIFAGSFLLFLVQPLIARMALPRLGGAPAVWNSAMLVYQALLLGGYAFAHWLGRFAPRRQAMIQCGALALAATMLPIGLSDLQPPPDANPFLFVPWLLAVSIGPLFLFVSAQAPLIQRWYSASGGGDPYPLYAASNLGSFTGLIAYPLVAEPMLSVAAQSRLWSGGFVALILLVAASAMLLPGTATAPAPNKAARIPIARSMLARWIVLSAIPSGLMLSTTLHLTTDLVAMPLLWVVPLGLYLLSFSVAFAENRRPADFVVRCAPIVLVATTYGVFADASPYALLLAGISIVALFVLCVALHSRLFDLRPDPARLTTFYLAMSAGGVIGGLFCALVAPLIFDWTYEHPILLIAAAWVVGGASLNPWLQAFWTGGKGRARAQRWAVVALVVVSLLQPMVGAMEPGAWQLAVTFGFALFALLVLGNRWLFALAIAAMMLALGGWPRLAMSLEPGRMTRSFFGVYSIRETPDHALLLFHGTTIHGIEATGSPEAEMRPTSYYAPRSGVGLAMRAAPAIYGPSARIDIVGLGAGTLACYSKPGQRWRFYEIDPVIADIARDPRQFRFLPRCQPKAPIIIGDARVSLSREASNAADILVVDAFSSDAVPMHLLTLEAFDTYRRHLAPNGLLMVHISNRFINLEPVLAAAASHGWNARIRYYDPGAEGPKQYFTRSLWVVLSPSPAIIAKLQASAPHEPWRPLRPRSGMTAWSDDFASILPIIKGPSRKIGP